MLDSTEIIQNRERCMKATYIIYVIVPIVLMVVFIKIVQPRLMDRLWLEKQREELMTRAQVYDPIKESSVSDLRFSPQGPILDEGKAKAVAESIWVKIYGADNIAFQKPFLAMEAKGCWHVQGTLPRGCLGGVAYIIITKDEGCVVKIWHTQ